MGRRLPIYFVVDCSESMVGQPIRDVERALAAVCGALRNDPQAIETAYVGLIAFAGISKALVPLTELLEFQMPTLPIGAGTNLSAALETLMSEFDRSLVRGTPEQKGDWKPVVYVMSDGRPTTDTSKSIEKWVTKYARRANVVGIGFGTDADLSVLSQLATSPQGVVSVFSYDPSKDSDMKAFVRWISQSVSRQSAAVGSDGLVVAPLGDDALRPASEVPDTQGDDRWVSVVARCGVKGTPFIARFATAGTNGNKGPLHAYEASYVLSESYIEWSGALGSRNTVSTDHLDSWPVCPVCKEADRSSKAQCDCGRLFCAPSTFGKMTCPWCKTPGEYRAVARLEVGQGRA